MTMTRYTNRRHVLHTTGGVLAGYFGLGELSGGDGSTGTATDTPTPTTSTPKPPSCGSTKKLTRSDVEGGGTITKDCYLVEGQLPIAGGTLTLEPGVWIKFAKDAGFDVRSDGRLRAKGKPDNKVVLTGTSETRGHWTGVRFASSRGSANKLEHTVVEYAGGSQWHGGEESRAGIFMGGDSSLALDGAVVRENGQAGIVAPSGDKQLSLANSVFQANELPAWVQSNLAGAFSPDNSFSNNDTGAVTLGVDGPRDSVSAQQTWQDPGVPFNVTHDVTLEEKVTIEEGATFRFGKQAGIDVPENGRLRVRGSGSSPVTFRGQAEQPASWKGIRFRKTRSEENVLEHAIVEYAGDSQWHGGGESRAGIFVQGSDVTLTIRNSTLRSNAKMGLTADGGGTDLTLESNAFEDNDAPLWLAANLVGGTTADNAFHGNDDSYVFVGVGGARTAVSDEATWAALDVPYRPTRNVSVRQPLELSPGTAFEFEQDTGMMVQNDGRLDADASGSDGISFSGTEAITGFWKGVYLYHSLSADNVFKNVVIEHGGSSGWHGGGNSVANLFLRGGDNASGCSIIDSVIRGSGKYGISIEEGSRLMDCSGITFENNQAAPTYNSATDGPIKSC